MKFCIKILSMVAILFATACEPKGDHNSTATENSGGESAVDITRVPGLDSGVLSKDSAGVTGDTNNIQGNMQR